MGGCDARSGLPLGAQQARWLPARAGIPPLRGVLAAAAATGLRGLSYGSADSTHHLTPPARPSGCEKPVRWVAGACETRVASSRAGIQAEPLPPVLFLWGCSELPALLICLTERGAESTPQPPGMNG